MALLCFCSQLGELLLAMGLDITEQEKNFPDISDYVSEIRRSISANS